MYEATAVYRVNGGEISSGNRLRPESIVFFFFFLFLFFFAFPLKVLTVVTVKTTRFSPRQTINVSPTSINICFVRNDPVVVAGGFLSLSNLDLFATSLGVPGPSTLSFSLLHSFALLFFCVRVYTVVGTLSAVVPHITPRRRFPLSTPRHFPQARNYLPSPAGVPGRSLIIENLRNDFRNNILHRR